MVTENRDRFTEEKLVVVFSASLLLLTLLGVRLGKLMLADSGYYAKLAEDLHERERPMQGSARADIG